MQQNEGRELPPSPPPTQVRKPSSTASLHTRKHALHHQYHSFNRYEDIAGYKDQLREERPISSRPTVKIKDTTQGEWNKQKESKVLVAKMLNEFAQVDNVVGVTNVKGRESRQAHDVLKPVDVLYKIPSRSNNDGDSINSYNSDVSKSKSVDQPPPPQYVEMGRSIFEMWDENPLVGLLEQEREIARRPFYTVKEESNNANGSKRSDRMVRRYTTEYRAPPQLVLPPLKNDSSDSGERSPLALHTSKNPYPYSVLTEQRAKKKKKSSITSSTSEENSGGGDAIATAIKLRMQVNEWRENFLRRGIDTQTVDRRSTKKHASKSAKMKRQGSFNIDPAGEFHLSLDVTRGRDMSSSVRSCNPAKSPLMDARKTPLQISAEDMVQIANCGARNKNGSLCHFISTTDDNYLSISQALLNQSSGSEVKIAENDTLTRKHRTLERKKKSTHSLALESSDETLCQQEKPALKDRREDKMLAMKRESEAAKVDTIERRHKSHTRQRSHDLEKSLKIAKYSRQDAVPARKLMHTKSEGQRSHKVTQPPPGYFLLEDENGHTVPLRLSDNHKENIKYQSPSLELLDKRSNTHLAEHHHKESCKCLMQSNHSLAKAEAGSYREKSDFSSDTDPGNPAFRRLGTSSREELTNSGGDVEESFDF